MDLCSKCGAELRPGAKFCSNCGASQAEVARAENFEPAPAEGSTSVAVQAAAGSPPPPPVKADPPRKISNTLIKSIIATVCCCVPFGVVGIIYAAKADAFLRQGDLAAAADACKKADLWSTLAIGVGLTVNVLTTVLMISYERILQ